MLRRFDKASRVGLGKITPHDLQRTFAKLARQSHTPLKQVQISLGHTPMWLDQLSNNWPRWNESQVLRDQNESGNASSSSLGALI